MERVVGIDYGTSTTIVATVKDGRPEAADNREGNKITDSVVHFSKEGKATVGSAALNLAIAMALYVVMEVKRLVGLLVVAFTHPDTGKEYSPVEITAIILADVVSAAEEYYGEKIRTVVITCPAYFDNRAREDTKKAGEMAGLKVLKILNEPTAAMIAYLYSHPNLPKGKYAVADLGGGTLDATIVEVDEEGVKVKTTEGNERLGGTDFTRVIEQLVLEEFKKNGIEFDPNVPEDAGVLQEVREKSEKAKKELSKLDDTTITVSGKGKTVSLTVTRKQFEELCLPLLSAIKETLLNAIKAGAGDPKNLKGVILVGGAIRTPCVQAVVEEITEGAVPILKDISADLAVAYGAAIEAARLSGQTEYALKAQKIQDVSTFDIGVAAHKIGDTDPNRMYVKRIVPKNSPLPAKGSAKFGMTSMGAGSNLQAELIVAEGKDNDEYRDSMKVQSFFLGDLPPSSDPTKPAIDVEVNVDDNGIIVAEATHIESGKKVRQQIDRKAIS